MHRLQPMTPYRIVTVRLCVPASLSDGEVADGLNELLRPATDPDLSNEQTVIDDYEIDDTSTKLYVTGYTPEEGEVFALENIKWATH